MITVTRRFTFDYAHHLPEYVGKCRRLHGHTGVLEVEVGEYSSVPNTYKKGFMIVDFGIIKGIVETEILHYLDHTYVNDLIEVPTAENMIEWIVERLQKIFEGGLLRVRLYETPDCYAEWKP